jgi:hypothetical protein
MEHGTAALFDFARNGVKFPHEGSSDSAFFILSFSHLGKDSENMRCNRAADKSI